MEALYNGHFPKGKDFQEHLTGEYLTLRQKYHVVFYDLIGIILLLYVKGQMFCCVIIT